MIDHPHCWSVAQRPSATVLLSRVQRLIRRDLELAFQEHGVTYAQFRALSLADAEPGLSGADLARRAHTSRQAMNQVVSSLVSNDLLSVSTDAPGSRRQRLHLTTSGHRVLGRCDATVEEIESAVLNGLDTSARDQLISLLEQVGGLQIEEGA